MDEMQYMYLKMSFQTIQQKILNQNSSEDSYRDDVYGYMSMKNHVYGYMSMKNQL